MRTNEEQLELFADLIEPCAEILSDKELAAAFQSGNRAKAIKLGIKSIDGVDVGAYKVPTPPVLAMKILSLFNNPEIAELFTPQAQNETATHSGSATESTEDGEN